VGDKRVSIWIDEEDDEGESYYLLCANSLFWDRWEKARRSEDFLL